VEDLADPADAALPPGRDHRARSTRKMVINALNSGADSYMTDFEDSNAPSWDNQIHGADQPEATRSAAR
jgi:malate synthase